MVLRFTKGTPPKSNRHPQLPVIAPAQAEIAALKQERDMFSKAMCEAAIPLEALVLSGRIIDLTPEMQEGITIGLEFVRDALARLRK